MGLVCCSPSAHSLQMLISSPFPSTPPSSQDWLLTADSWLSTDLTFPIGPCYIALAQTTHKTLLPIVCLLFCVFVAAEMCLLHYCSTMATCSCSIIPAFSHHITILLSLLRCNSLSPPPKLFASKPVTVCNYSAFNYRGNRGSGMGRIQHFSQIVAVTADSRMSHQRW
jgi:hypothetical protein